MSLVENNEPQINFDSLKAPIGPRRRFQLFIALALLLTALGLVVLKNRKFWTDSLNLSESADQTMSDTLTKSQHPANPNTRRKTSKHNASSAGEPSEVASAEAQETVLSPLQIDVTYSSGQHKTFVARNFAVQVNIDRNSQPSFVIPAAAASTGSETVTTSTGERVRFSSQAVEVLGSPAEPIYPPLAQQANVQGSVVLQAKIGEDGNVHALQVLSGPAILTNAAFEAVKQWHFKPHYEGGQAVPTETRITVNFTISTQ